MRLQELNAETFRLYGRMAIVTGAATGIGRAIATSSRQTALQCASWTLVGHKQKRLRRRLPGLVELPRHMNAM
jgi:NAD(P)-dependent dehydrogenase (short-subunit alcohol dehydrogenase family)